MNHGHGGRSEPTSRGAADEINHEKGPTDRAMRYGLVVASQAVPNRVRTAPKKGRGLHKKATHRVRVVYSTSILDS